MGVVFNDPDLELSDIFWYITLADHLDEPRNANFVTVDREIKVESCFVELHRIGELKSCITEPAIRT